MNKEQLRKELEDCWDAAVEYYDYVKSKPIGYRDGKFPDRKEYLTTRLAALDDGQEGKGLPKFLVIDDHENNYAIWTRWQYESYVSGALEVGGCPAVKIITGFNGHEDFLFPKTLPVADGEVEKMKQAWNIDKAILKEISEKMTAYEKENKILKATVTGGVKDDKNFGVKLCAAIDRRFKESGLKDLAIEGSNYDFKEKEVAFFESVGAIQITDVYKPDAQPPQWNQQTIKSYSDEVLVQYALEDYRLRINADLSKEVDEEQIGNLEKTREDVKRLLMNFTHPDNQDPSKRLISMVERRMQNAGITNVLIDNLPKDEYRDMIYNFFTSLREI